MVCRFFKISLIFFGFFGGVLKRLGGLAYATTVKKSGYELGRQHEHSLNECSAFSHEQCKRASNSHGAIIFR
jgi:hypothetical protein